MVDILDGQIELEFVAFPVTTVFRSPVRQDTQQAYVMFLIPGDDTVVEHISSYQRVLTVVELDEGYLISIGIDEGLLVRPALMMASKKGVRQ